MFEIKRRPASGGPPSSFSNPDKGAPLIWVERIGMDVYLINATDEVLTSVISTSGGCFTSDGKPYALASDNVAHYQDVLPGESVKVEEYDEYYDLDYLLQIQIKIESFSLGKREFLTLARKGGASTQVLLRDDMPAANR